MRLKIFAGTNSSVERDANRWLADNPSVTIEKLSTAKDQGVLSLTFLYTGGLAGEHPASVDSKEFFERPWKVEG